MSLVRYPVLLRLVVWGHTREQALRAGDEAWLHADMMGWTIVGVTTAAYGGKASEQLAQAEAEVHGDLHYQCPNYDRVYRLYDAPLNDPANLEAFARWATTLR